jgi:hypothetical protein
MGYVDIKEKITLGFALSVVLPLIFLPIVMYLIVWVLNDFPGIASVIRWMAVAFGLVFGALYFSYAKKFGRKTYYVLMIVSVIAGAVFSQFSLALAEPAVVILLNSFILLIFGVSLLIRFHHRYPKPRKIRVEYNADAEDQDSQADNG